MLLPDAEYEVIYEAEHQKYAVTVTPLTKGFYELYIRHKKKD